MARSRGKLLAAIDRLKDSILETGGFFPGDRAKLEALELLACDKPDHAIAAYVWPIHTAGSDLEQWGDVLSVVFVRMNGAIEVYCDGVERRNAIQKHIEQHLTSIQRGPQYGLHCMNVARVIAEKYHASVHPMPRWRQGLFDPTCTKTATP